MTRTTRALVLCLGLMLGLTGCQSASAPPKVAALTTTVAAPTTAPAKSVATTVPSHTLTPGVKTAVSAAKICSAGYAAKVPAATAAQVKTVFLRYKIPAADRASYVVDRLIPAALGGTSATKNLWPITKGDRHDKAIVGNKLHNMVCAGQLSLAAAQRAVTADWSAAFARYGGSAKLTYVRVAASPPTASKTSTSPAATVPPTAVPTTKAATTVAVPTVAAPTVDTHGGATAQCNDGSLSYSAHRRGTCSHHGGVAIWF